MRRSKLAINVAVFGIRQESSITENAVNLLDCGTALPQKTTNFGNDKFAGLSVNTLKTLPFSILLTLLLYKTSSKSLL